MIAINTNDIYSMLILEVLPLEGISLLFIGEGLEVQLEGFPVFGFI
jgi:hypothetical protein